MSEKVNIGNVRGKVSGSGKAQDHGTDYLPRPTTYPTPSSVANMSHPLIRQPQSLAANSPLQTAHRPSSSAANMSLTSMHRPSSSATNLSLPTMYRPSSLATNMSLRTMHRPSSSFASQSQLSMHQTPNLATSCSDIHVHSSALHAPHVQPYQVMSPPCETISEYQGMDDATYNASVKPQLEIIMAANGKIIGLGPPNPDAKELTDIFENSIDEGAATWKKVTKRTKNFYYGEFGKDYKWRKSENAHFRAAWEIVSSKRYSDWVHSMKKKIWMKGGKVPTCFTTECWNSFVNHWLSPEHQEISLRNKKNRRCGSEDLEAKAPAAHTGGRKPNRDHAKDKALLAGGEPLKHIDLYSDLHKPKDNDDHHYNSRVNHIITEFNKRKAEEEVLASQMPPGSNHLPKNDNELFFEVIGPPKKGRWTGALTETSVTPIGGAQGFASAKRISSSQQAFEDRLLQRVLTTLFSSEEMIREVVLGMATNKEINISKDNSDKDKSDEDWMETYEKTMSGGMEMEKNNENMIDDDFTTPAEPNVGVNDQQFFTNLLTDNIHPENFSDQDY